MKQGYGHIGTKIPEKILRRLYYEEGLSLKEVGRPYHLSGEAVRWQMIHLNLPRIDRTKRFRNQYTAPRGPEIISDGTVGEE